MLPPVQTLVATLIFAKGKNANESPAGHIAKHDPAGHFAFCSWQKCKPTVAVPDIFLGDGAPASAIDRGHSLRSLHLPLAALPSLPPAGRHRTSEEPAGHNGKAITQRVIFAQAKNQLSNHSIPPRGLHLSKSDGIIHSIRYYFRSFT